MLCFMISALVTLLSLTLRLAARLRLTLPLLYALLAPSVFGEWFACHPVLANGIGRALLCVSLLSWGCTTWRRLRAAR